MPKNRDSVMKPPDSSMERRLSLRLLEKEIEKKKAKMDSTSSPEVVEPIIQNSPIFDPEIRDVLPNIINNLDSGSFARLARTCKEMNSICFNDKEIQIPCWTGEKKKTRILVGVDQLEPTFVLKIKNREYAADSEFVKKLPKMPFIYHVDDLIVLEAVDERLLRVLRRCFVNIPRVVIGHLDLWRDVFDWEVIIEFIKEFRIPSVFCCPVIPLEFLPFFTQELAKFRYCYNVPDDIILGATAKTLRITNSSISKETFKKLIEKFVAGDIENWEIGRDGPMYDESDLLFRAVSEMMKTVRVKRVDRKVMRPSTAYFKPSRDSDKKQFYVLKSDGSLASFTMYTFYVSFDSR